MAVPFEYPPDNMTGIVDMLNHVANLVNTNSTIGGFFGVGILIVIAVVSFMITKTVSSEKAFVFSGFITLISAILLRFMNLISDGIMYVVVILFAGIVVWLWMSRQQEVGV